MTFDEFKSFVGIDGKPDWEQLFHILESTTSLPEYKIIIIALIGLYHSDPTIQDLYDPKTYWPQLLTNRSVAPTAHNQTGWLCLIDFYRAYEISTKIDDLKLRDALLSYIFKDVIQVLHGFPGSVEVYFSKLSDQEASEFKQISALLVDSLFEKIFAAVPFKATVKDNKIIFDCGSDNNSDELEKTVTDLQRLGFSSQYNKETACIEILFDGPVPLEIQFTLIFLKMFPDIFINSASNNPSIPSRAHHSLSSTYNPDPLLIIQLNNSLNKLLNTARIIPRSPYYEILFEITDIETITRYMEILKQLKLDASIREKGESLEFFLLLKSDSLEHVLKTVDEALKLRETKVSLGAPQSPTLFAPTPASSTEAAIINDFFQPKNAFSLVRQSDNTHMINCHKDTDPRELEELLSRMTDLGWKVRREHPNQIRLFTPLPQVMSLIERTLESRNKR